MKWNNGKERKKFEAEQARLREQYIAASMTEEQIQAMYDYDLSVLNGNRREAIHNQRLDIQAFDDEDTDDGQNPLLEKFADKLTVEIDRNAVNRYSWMDEISDEKIVRAVKHLSIEDIEFITLLVFDGYTQDEVAAKLGIHKSNISRRFTKIKNFLKNFS